MLFRQYSHTYTQTHTHYTRHHLLMCRCYGTRMSAEAALTASTAKGYVHELRALELPQLQPLWALKANNKLLVIPCALSCVNLHTHTLH